MTRLDLLKILVGQARSNGFEFRRWYTGSLRLPWQSQDAALDVLSSERRYFALLFSHDFARCFWKAGATMDIQLPAQSFQRTMPDGSVRTIQRKPFMRRRSRPDAWKYHLREMAATEEPLRYMRKYLRVEDELSEVEDKKSDAGKGGPAVPAVAPARATLELARKAAERRRQRELDALPQAEITSRSKRGPRLPGAR